MIRSIAFVVLSIALWKAMWVGYQMLILVLGFTNQNAPSFVWLIVIYLLALPATLGLILFTSQFTKQDSKLVLVVILLGVTIKWLIDGYRYHFGPLFDS